MLRRTLYVPIKQLHVCIEDIEVTWLACHENALFIHDIECPEQFDTLCILLGHRAFQVTGSSVKANALSYETRHVAKPFEYLALTEFSSDHGL